MPTRALSIHTTIFDSSTWPTALSARSFGQKTVTCPVGLSTMQGGLFLFEAEAQSGVLAGFRVWAAQAPSVQRHKRRLRATKRRLGKALPTRTCFSIPKSSSVELAEQRSDRFTTSTHRIPPPTINRFKRGFVDRR